MAGDGHGRLLIGVAALAMTLGACGGDSDDGAAAADVVADAESALDDTALAADRDTELADSTVGATSVPSKPLAEDALPGETFDLFPAAGAAMTVVGVEVGDVLNVRVGPGPEYDVVTTLAPTSNGDALATGRNRSVDSGIWAEVEIGDIVGWSNTAYLLQAGSVDDDTTNLYPTAADHPIDVSLEALGHDVADAYASIDPSSRVVVVDGPNLDDLSTITIDVLGLGDDSVGGYRVAVYAESFDAGFRVRTVEATTLCTRGVDGGMCV